MTDALQPFAALYDDRHVAARAWKARTGGKVVGYVGVDVPEEIIMAAGLLPVRVCGDPLGPTDAVRDHVEATADPGVKSIAARLLDGTYDFLDHLVISVTPSIYGALYGWFVELRRLNPELALPTPHVFDFFHSAARISSLFDRESLRLLRSRLEEWSGQPLTDERLAAAIAACNGHRRLLGEVADLRKARALTGTEALRVIGTAYTTPKEEHVALLRSLTSALRQAPAQTRTPVVYSGTETENTATYEAIEAGGAIIVADDQEWGGRVAEVLVDESLPPIDALCDRYQFRSPQAAGRPVRDRKAYLADLVARSGAKAVVFNILAIDHPSSWDYPRLRDHLTALGIPSVELGPRSYGGGDEAEVQAKTSRFLTTLLEPVR